MTADAETMPSLAESARDLQAMLDQHCRSVDEAFCGLDSVTTRCARQRILRRAVVDAIQAIEATRKAFKSRQLEAVRLNLIRALAESE